MVYPQRAGAARPRPPIDARERSGTTVVQRLKIVRDAPECYASDERFLCRIETCDWRVRCRRLIAEWKR
jgi:hypothetical protein